MKKMWNIASIAKMGHRDTKQANAVGKTVQEDLLDAGLPQTFKLEKTQYLQCFMAWARGNEVCLHYLAPRGRGTPELAVLRATQGMQ